MNRNKYKKMEIILQQGWWNSEIGDPEDLETGIEEDNVATDNKLTVEYFGYDLTKEAQQGKLDPVIWREKLIDQVIYTLLRKTKNNPLLIGEAGVGKTAIVEWLAQRIVEGKVPLRLRNKRIIGLDMGSLVAGTKYRWEFEERLKAILKEAADPQNNIILFIDEIHTIIGAWNAEWSADAANILKPFLARGKIQLIGATTFDEYQKYIEKDAALKRRFQEIYVDEPSEEDTIEILKWLRPKYEEYHGVNISDEAIESAVRLSKRYLLNKYLPDKAIDLIDEASARRSTLSDILGKNEEYKKLEEQQKKIQEKIEKAIEEQDYFGAAELKEKEDEIKEKMRQLRTQNVLPPHLRETLKREDIGKVLAEKSGIPEDKITSSEIQKLRDLDKILKSKIFGQDEAVDAVVRAIRRNRLSVVKRDKPIASFLFLGPSGVGKTYLAKLLAKEFFGDERSLIRVDMSEFMEKYSTSKLIGSAPGYVGYEEGGILTEAVRRRPYSVVLFDEIEKASKDVLNILLQILDEGYLKDSKGRMVDFKNTIVILTSNIGSEEFAKEVPKIWFTAGDKKDGDFEEIKGRVLERLKKYLPPEFLNRLDGVIVFKPLSKEVLEQIMETKLSEFLKQWKKEGIKLPRFTKKQISQIIDKISEPQYGARPLERYIYEEIEPKLIDQVLEWAQKKSSSKS